MELKYDFGPDGNIINIQFDGLNGRERITSVKQALSTLQVKNPALAFTRDVKAGLYDSIPDEEYNNMLCSVNCISLLWRYKEDEPAGKSTQADMNVLMLLANAIELISRQNLELQNHKYLPF